MTHHPERDPDGPATEPGLAVAWLATTHAYDQHAMSTMDRTWRHLRSLPEWEAWIQQHVRFKHFKVLNIEDREKRRIMVRDGQVFFYLPVVEMVAAAEMNTVARLAAEIHYEAHARLAKKEGWPPPPPVTDEDLASVPSRLP